MKRHRRRRTLAPYLFLAPSLLCVSLFVLLPFLDAVRRSFYSTMSGQFVGLQNYRTVLHNAAFRLAVGNTLRFTLLCIPVLVALALLLALLLQAAKDERGVYKTTFLAPLAIPVASIVLLWKVAFHQNGMLNSLLSHFGVQPVDWLQTDWAFLVLVLSYLWKNTGYDMVLWLSGLQNISPALYEAAQVDGANARQRFFKITLPCLLPELFTISVLSLLNSFKVFREAYLIGGDYPHDSIYLLQHLFSNWFTSLDVDKMCAAATLVALAVLLLIFAMQAAWGRKENR